MSTRHDSCPNRIEVINLNTTTTLNAENPLLACSGLAESRASCEMSVEILIGIHMLRRMVPTGAVVVKKAIQTCSINHNRFAVEHSQSPSHFAVEWFTNTILIEIIIMIL